MKSVSLLKTATNTRSSATMMIKIGRPTNTESVDKTGTKAYHRIFVDVEPAKVAQEAPLPRTPRMSPTELRNVVVNLF